MTMTTTKADNVLQFGRFPKIVELPNLVEIQTQAWEKFLALDTPAGNRLDAGLQALLGEVFPIYSYDKTLCLEYVSYELGRPRYTVEECRKLRVTFGYPFKIRVRLVKPEPVEEDIYLGEIPIMIGGGEFIINGSERVTVSQLHRSPGVFFDHDRGKTHSSGKLLYSARVIPSRGSWLDFEFDPKDCVFWEKRALGRKGKHAKKGHAF